MRLIKGLFINFIMFLVFISIFLIIGGDAMSQNKDEKKGIKETSIFKIDQDKNQIISCTENIKTYMKLNFISVTTDQPIYWPDEDVYLKVLMPDSPDEKIKIILQKKDSTPKELNDFILNEAGLLVEKIMKGSEKKLEAGEYTVFVKNIKTNVESYSTFTVVEGALGAISFAHEFKKITNAQDLQNVKGGWFLGNAGGIGKRWGNGLNIKNELRVLNKPYTGEAMIKTRCYLSGCNGIEAGQAVSVDVKDGLIEAVLDVGGHSGPFGIDVITKEGSIQYVFEKSGHVERENIPLTKGLSNKFYATLASYEGATGIYGRDIYVFMQKNENENNPFELASPVANASNEIEIRIKQDIINPKAYIVYNGRNNSTKVDEIKLEPKLVKGSKLNIKCNAPYSMITIGGFLQSNNEFCEGWGIVFTESPADVELNCVNKGMPLKSYDVNIKTSNKNTDKAISVFGILEVYDNRVISKSGKEPLVSTIGDSFRNLSNYLSTWYDSTGYDDNDQSVCESVDEDTKVYSSIKKRSNTTLMKDKSTNMSRNKNGKLDDFNISSEQEEEEQETIREGEKKVVYCGLIKTGIDGTANISIKLPPQTGRCNIRFTVIDKFDYFEKISTIDVLKDTSVELSIQNLFIPEAKIIAKASVVNNEKDQIKLFIYGACLNNKLEYDINQGSQDIEFELIGKNYGSLFLELKNNNGKTLDKREVKLNNVASHPVTFSGLIISNGKPITIDKNKKIAVYSNPGLLLKGIAANINTSMHSWFGHSEALSAKAVINAILLRAIDDGLISGEGMRDNLKAEMVKAIRDLNEVFYDRNTNLFIPYPGLNVDLIWSVWVYNNLKKTADTIKDSKNLSQEFKESINITDDMLESVKKELKKKNVSFEENGFITPEGKDVIPIEIDGKIVYKLITDDAVIKWFVTKIVPSLDLPACKNLQDLNYRFIKQYDIYRFLRAFERTGNIYYLLLNAKALYLNNDPNFFPLFNAIAKGLINTQDPGIIQGPALLGGVYSSPQTVIKFLELLITMSKDKNISNSCNIEIINNSTNKKEIIKISDIPKLLETMDSSYTIKAPIYVTIRIDEERTINLYDYLEKKSFFKIKNKSGSLKMGDESVITVELDGDRDPSEYYAIIALPSTMSLKQTEDLLSDYKGQLLFGQRTEGSTKIQFVTVPFRGSRVMNLAVEASQKGHSVGYVLVRHISNPDIISTVKIDSVIVK